MPFAAIISPLYSVSIPDKILRKVDFPEPFTPTIPILAFGKKDKLDYGKIGTGKSGLGTIKSEIERKFDFKKGSVGLARSLKYNTEDSQFFIILEDEPLFEGEFTPIGKVIYGIKVLEKVKYSNRSEYVLRPDFINTIRMYKKN